MLVQPITPVIVKIVDAPTEELSVVDVILQALSLTGLLLLGSLLLGAMLGAFFIWMRRRQTLSNDNETVGSFGLDLRPPPR